MKLCGLPNIQIKKNPDSFIRFKQRAKCAPVLTAMEKYLSIEDQNVTTAYGSIRSCYILITQKTLPRSTDKF